MFKNLFFISLTFLLLATSCSENSTNTEPANIPSGFYCDFSGSETLHYTAETATSVKGIDSGKTILSIMATSTISGNDYQFIITVFGTKKGTYNQKLADGTEPDVICTLIIGSGEYYVSDSGKLTISEIGTTLGSRVKGTFNFHLFNTSLEKEITLTNGTINVPVISL